ncbi:MAG: flavin prenyltransferase UbiX [Chlamydiales bacterium]
MGRYVLGVSGASGFILAYRAIRIFGELGHDIELVITPSALYTAAIELGEEFKTIKRFVAQFSPLVREKIQIHSVNDLGAAIASGSYLTDGMLIIPCSMSTVGALSVGLTDNTLRRAADVTLKEGRPLVIVPRETPLSEIHLENLLRLSRRGVTIIPPVPAWYTLPQTLEDIENFIVGKALDAFKIEHHLYQRWKTPASSKKEIYVE